jgi:hypothetical protein
MEHERPSLQEQFRGSGRQAEDKRSDFWNPTLNVQFRAGHCMAFLYSHLIWMNWDKDIGIILHFSSHTLKLEGRNLGRLYSDLKELKLREIRVVAKEHDLGDSDEPVVLKATVNQVVAGER